MQYRVLGDSGIAVSVIGFGCGGNARLMVGDDEALRLATLRAALQAGVNYFDTAPAYGDGRSESNLGADLRMLGVRPVISTKVVLQGADLTDARSAVLRSFDQSVARLGFDDVDMLILHNRVFQAADGDDYGIGAKVSLRHIFGSRGVLAAFHELVGSGRTKVGGFTAYGGDPSAIRSLIDTRAFGVLSVSLNVLNPSAVIKVPATFDEPNYEEVVVRAYEAGMGIVAIQVLGRGALTDVRSLDKRTSALGAQALACDDSLPSVAIRYVLTKAAVTTAVLGLSEPSHVRDALSAVAKGVLPIEVERTLERIAVQEYS